MSITVWQALSDHARKMAQNALQDVHSLDDWQQRLPARRQQFMHALGLEPLPARCDLKTKEYGTFTGDGFRARRIAFQILPDCWSSACIYYPDPLQNEALPGVLYVCGHAPIGTHHYQAHPIMWARRGYVCLIVDTIEQNDNPGEHHGTHTGEFETWTALGYTAAGGEVWNSMRALDVLADDPHVDAGHLGATGVSGGGAVSFHLAIADERVKAVSSLCGVSTPLDAITNRHVMGHCGCFYVNNLYLHDTSEYAALIAPRAAMFCFADHDPLFHPQEVRALVERTRRIYALYGEPAKCELVTCPGPHGDHPPFDEATCRWFDQHVAGERRPAVPRGAIELEESTTGVFQGRPPVPNQLDLLPRLLCSRGTLPLPAGPDDWPSIRKAALEKLRAEVMPAPREDSTTFTLDGEWQWGWAGECPTSVREYVGHVAGVEVLLREVRPPNARHVVLSVAGEGESWSQALAWIATALKSESVAYAALESRLAGRSAPAAGVEPEPVGSWPETLRSTYLRAMALVGLTPVTMIMRDVVLAVNSLHSREDEEAGDIYLHGRGEAGVACLYTALFDERIAGVVVEDVPGTHLQGAPLLGVLRAFDMPQAIGLMAPRKIALVTAGHATWTWPTRVYGRLGCAARFIHAGNVSQALEKLLP